MLESPLPEALKPQSLAFLKLSVRAQREREQLALVRPPPLVSARRVPALVLPVLPESKPEARAKLASPLRSAEAQPLLLDVTQVRLPALLPQQLPLAASKQLLESPAERSAVQVAAVAQSSVARGVPRAGPPEVVQPLRQV